MMYSFLVRLAPEQVTALRAIAQAEGNSIAAVIRRAIAELLATATVYGEKENRK